LRRERAHPILFVGHWGRPLAQSARRGGIDVVVFDLFADAQTRGYALRAHSIAAANEARIDMQRAAALARECAADCDALVYGAGFEREPEHIARIAAGREILGNTTASIQAVKHPAALSALLRQVAMPHPTTTLQAPDSPAGWLVKRSGEQGGAHVLPFTLGHVPRAGDYFQRRMNGVPCSALFIADGKRARVIGFSEQLTVALGGAPYCYGGAVSHMPLPTAITTDIKTKLDELVRRTALVGLNSIDFIVDDERYFVLEVNPRPSATMDLYDADCPGGLLAWHIAACAGELSEAPLTSNTIRGHAIAYARRAGQVPLDFDWPAWCSDTEPSGATLAAGMPACMVHASGAAHEETKDRLLERRQAVLRALAVDYGK
jgi:uncharacterized protein